MSSSPGGSLDQQANALRSLNLHTASGPDGVYNEALGPLPFNISRESISAVLDQSDAEHCFYGDDLTIIAQGRERESARNRALDTLSDWCRFHFMEVTVDKTMVCNSRTCRHESDLQYGGEKLEFEGYPKLLGIVSSTRARHGTES